MDQIDIYQAHLGVLQCSSDVSYDSESGQCWCNVLANNHASNQRMKRISVRQHFIREYNENCLIKIIFVKFKFNTADIFTKNFNQELFIRHSTNIMNRMIESEDDMN